MSQSRTTTAAAPRLIDTVRHVATPEGIELTLRLAGPVPRALAWTIDFLIRLGALAAIATVAGILGGLGMAVMLLSWFALEWLVPAWCEVYWAGATPGKKALGLAVVHDDGRPVAWPAALTRNLLRAVDFLPLLYGFGLVAMLLGRDFKRLGDMAAGTVVVYRDKTVAARTVPKADAVAPVVPLAIPEQRAILDFAEDPTDRLVGIANHLLGREREA